MSPIILGGCIAVSAAVALMDHQRRVIQSGDPIVMTVEEGTLEIKLYDINDLIRDQLEKLNVAMLNLKDSANTRNTQMITSINERMTNTINENNKQIKAVSSGYPMSKVFNAVHTANAVFEDRKRALGNYCHKNSLCRIGRTGH